MLQITVETQLGSQLTGLQGQVLLCDDTGRALGFFSPLPEPLRVEDLQLEPPSASSIDDKHRRVRTGKPLAEILERLNNR